MVFCADKTERRLTGWTDSPFLLRCSQAVRLGTLTPACAGSNPATSAHVCVAQLAAHETFNLGVAGSSPAADTFGKSHERSFDLQQ